MNALVTFALRQRVLVVILLVLALAGFFTNIEWLSRLEPRPSRN